MDPTGKHEERAEEHKGKHGEEREKHSTDKRSITQGLDHRTQRDTRDPKSTTDDTSGGSSSPRGGLESTRDLPVKGS